MRGLREQGCMAALHGRTVPSAAALTPFFRANPVPFRLWNCRGRAKTVTGSYRTPSGTTGGAVHGPRTVPTASGSAREIPGAGGVDNFLYFWHALFAALK